MKEQVSTTRVLDVSPEGIYRILNRVDGTELKCWYAARQIGTKNATKTVRSLKYEVLKGVLSPHSAAEARMAIEDFERFGLR